MADSKGSTLPVVTPTAGDRAIGVDDPLATTASVGFLTEDLNPNISITAAETAEGLTEANIDVRFEPGDPFRYGADPTGAVASDAAIQTAVDILPTPSSKFFPSRYSEGGGTVELGDGVFLIDNPIVLSHNQTLIGQGRGATTLKTSANIDAIQFRYDLANLAQIFIRSVGVKFMTLDGDKVGESGLTGRNGSDSRPVSFSHFEEVECVGFKTGFHFFGGWNNTFINCSAQANNTQNDDLEGMFGFIGETVSLNTTYGPSGHTVTARGGDGGFNNNNFISCEFRDLKRVGVHIRAISTSHARSNNFTDCNLEQIIKRTTALNYAPYTDLTATPEGGSLETLFWDGRAIGCHFLGRIDGLTVHYNYFERISDQDVNTGGEGFIFDDLNIKFGGGASKNLSNTFSRNFVNSNVARVGVFDRCQECDVVNNDVLLSGESEEGYLVTSNAASIVFERSKLSQINSSSANKFSWFGAVDGLGLNDAILDTARGTINTGANPGLDIYRDGMTSNFDAIRFRNGTNAATLSRIGFGNNQLLLDAITSVLLKVNNIEVARAQSTGFVPANDDSEDLGSAAKRWQNIVCGGHTGIGDGITAPATVSGTTFIYVDTADGDIKVKFGDGTIRKLTDDAAAQTYTRNTAIVEDRTLLASASATIINNNNVLAALIADLQARGVIV